MASIIITGTFTTAISSISRWANDLSLTIPMTGSNVTQTVQNITTASWQGLDTASLSDLRYFYADNVGSGSIKISSDISGSNLMAIMQPNDTCMIPWSGSVSLYAKAFNSASVLQYNVSES